MKIKSFFDKWLLGRKIKNCYSTKLTINSFKAENVFFRIYKVRKESCDGEIINQQDDIWWWYIVQGWHWRYERHLNQLKPIYANEIKPNRDLPMEVQYLPTPIITTRKHRVSKRKTSQRWSEHQKTKICVQKRMRILNRELLCKKTTDHTNCWIWTRPMSRTSVHKNGRHKVGYKA